MFRVEYCKMEEGNWKKKINGWNAEAPYRRMERGTAREGEETDEEEVLTGTEHNRPSRLLKTTSVLDLLLRSWRHQDQVRQNR